MDFDKIEEELKDVDKSQLVYMSLSFPRIMIGEAQDIIRKISDIAPGISFGVYFDEALKKEHV